MIINCLHCNNEIEAYKTRSKAIRKFCDRSCAASYNNKLYPKKKYDPFTLKKDMDRSSIALYARKVLMEADVPKKCKVCEYDGIALQACHIISVSSFSPDTPIAIINSLSNLVWLCANHHIEFDAGIQSTVLFNDRD